jgi:hypothetical protein
VDDVAALAIGVRARDAATVHVSANMHSTDLSFFIDFLLREVSDWTSVKLPSRQNKPYETALTESGKGPRNISFSELEVLC